MTGLEFAALTAIVRETFAARGETAVEQNLAVAEAGYTWGAAAAPDFAYRLPPAPAQAEPLMLMHANHGVALGAIAAGCKVVSGYPMTPWSSILEYCIEHRDVGLVAVQMEDEIAAISFALGASFAGARAPSGSSGGGFALMVEHLSLAGMCEVPLVIVEVQRGGPGTGMPTRTEQADLLFAVNPAHGDFPLILTAVKDPVDAFYRTAKAFNLADQYQCPVIVMSDLHLSNALQSVPLSALDQGAVIAAIDRGATLTHDDLETLPQPYERFAITLDGVSPRAIPGHANAIVHAMSDEHDAIGAISEDPENRRAMVEKRARKLALAQAEMAPPEVYGAPDAAVSLVAWGGTYGTLREVVDRSAGAVQLIHYTDLVPFPIGGDQPLRAARHLVAVEQNATAQLATYLRAQTGIEISQRILKYDGRPMTPDWVLEQVEELGR